MTLLVDVGRHTCECTDHALDELYKAAADPPSGSTLWSPHEHPLISAHIEAVTERGMSILEEIQESIDARFRGKPIAPRLVKALSWARWTDKQVREAENRLAGKAPSDYTLEDWMVLVDMVVQRYLPDTVILSEADYLAVRSVIAGKVQVNMDRMGGGSAAMAAVGAALGDAARAAGVPLFQDRIMEFARLRAAELITDIGERTRHRLKSIILEHQSGGHPDWQALSSQMFDEFSILNRDWRRVAITECARNWNEGFIASLEPGAKVRRVEAYAGACPFCRSINGRVFTVVDSAKEDKDGETEVWVGKTNVGRSASPRKRVGDELVERAPSEMWWVAAGVQHPNCFIDPAVPVYTSAGWRPIADIKVGDSVLTHAGRFMPVNWVLDPDACLYDGQAVSLRVGFDGKNFVSTPAMTPEHPVLTDRGWVAVNDVASGDSVISLGKPCPTCGKIFANHKFDHVRYCCKRCHPKLGKNQFSTDDEEMRARAVLVTAAANRARMQRMTVEQRRDLTKAARAEMRKKGYSHLYSRESRKAGNRIVARNNYTPSDSEREIASVLSCMGFHPELQYRIRQLRKNRIGNARYWWADIALPEQKIVVEIDGDPWHGKLAEPGRDADRDADLGASGWTVLRFSSDLAKADAASVAEEVGRVAMNHSGEYQFVSMEVQSVRRRTVKGRRLYNFGVDGDESYIVRGGLVVHNCRGSWSLVEETPPDVDPDFVEWARAHLENVRP